MSILKVIGAISGTSMDGIDVALIETDGLFHVTPLAGRLYPYAPDLRNQLQSIIENPEIAEHGDLTEIEQAVSDAHSDAVLQFCKDICCDKKDICSDKSEIALVGLHGQTVLHRPERNFTRQLGLGQRMADLIGINVVNRFRHADIAAGGHGAPLVPLYHQALAHRFNKPLIILNLGGVANITYIDTQTLIAFDTGPASALLDDFVKTRTGRPYDENGALALSGTVNQPMLDAFMSNPFFDLPPPKSLDRQDFKLRAKCVETLSDADGAATLAAFTVHSVARALQHVPKTPVQWLVAGGGRLNNCFMQGFRKLLNVPVESVDTVGWNGDFLEAECFAYLALRSRLGLPLSLPSTTGVPEPMTGGEFWESRSSTPNT